jgi:hypothetical protein
MKKNEEKILSFFTDKLLDRIEKKTADANKNQTIIAELKTINIELQQTVTKLQQELNVYTRNPIPVSDKGMKKHFRLLKNMILNARF